MKLNEKLKQLRKQYNMSQEELAGKINVSRQAVTKWETGGGLPDIENLKLLSEIFNISVDSLLEDIVNKEVNEENYIYENVLKYEIETTKDFELNISNIKILNLIPNNNENVIMKISSNTIENVDNDIKIKNKNTKYKFEMDVKGRKISSKNNLIDLVITLYLPIKYIINLELNGLIETVNVNSFDARDFEIGGIIQNVVLNDFRGNLEVQINTNTNITYNKFVSNLEISSISSVVKVNIPCESDYKVVVGGINSKIERLVDDVKVGRIKMSGANLIELNGINNKLILNEGIKK